ncbi:hypothetical protein [Arcobacter sp. L]|uniref:hypothetical protein n=1 Tax=Arcobacter sp. L TaxID=944547 RepID=UPI0002295F78|nr:hypothetical protein [Arcobacter sp. L]BAK72832.1 hypothetical protein ABLL_0957 [Arcobacter sp. L]
MTFKETMAALFSTAEGTYYKWKKEERPIIKLLDKYFSKEELEEFLSTEKINKLENLNSYSFSSSVGFIIKLKLLLNKNDFDGTSRFVSFIAYYIKLKIGQGEDSFYFKNSNLKIYEKNEELRLFQNLFIKFVMNNLNSNIIFGELDDLKYYINFIDNFNESDLIFLNMNINDNFKTLLDSKNINYLNADGYIRNFEHRMLDYFEKELNRKGNLEDLISEYKLKCIKDLEGK